MHNLITNLAKIVFSISISFYLFFIETQVYRDFHQDTVIEQHLEDFQLEVPTVEVPNGSSEQTNHLCYCTEPLISRESYAQIIHTNPTSGSGEEVEPQNLCTISSFTNSFHQFDDEENMKVEGSPSSESERTEAINILPSVSLEAEQLLFGVFDEVKSSEIQIMESEFPGNMDIENFPSCSPDGTEELDTDQSHSPPEKFVEDNQSTDSKNSMGNMRVASSPIGITRSHKAGRMAESLPIIWSQIDGFGAHDDHWLSHSLDSNSEPLKWTMQSKDNLSSIIADGNEEHQFAAELLDIKDALVTGELKDIPFNPAIGKTLSLFLLNILSYFKSD